MKLLEHIKAECPPKANTECATVCCVLPEINDTELITLVIDSNAELSNEYRLKYECKENMAKPKVFNNVIVT